MTDVESCNLLTVRFRTSGGDKSGQLRRGPTFMVTAAERLVKVDHWRAMSRRAARYPTAKLEGTNPPRTSDAKISFSPLSLFWAFAIVMVYLIRLR
jgi:hypothetical protein